MFNFVSAIHINKTIINSSNNFFTNQITFVLLLFVSDSLCLLFSTSENKLRNFLTDLLFKNSYPGKFSYLFCFTSITSLLSVFVLISFLFSPMILIILGSSFILSSFSFSFFSSSIFFFFLFC